MSPENQQAVMRMLELSSDLSTAYYYKELLLGIRDIEDLSKKADRFYTVSDSMSNSGIYELERCAATLFNWSPSIVNSLGYPFSNGFTEGCNNKIKVLKRIAYGYRNLDHFRARILHSFS